MKGDKRRQTAALAHGRGGTNKEGAGASKMRREGGKEAAATRMDDLEEAVVELADWTNKRIEKLDKLLSSIEARLLGGDFKATVGDFIRLLQLRQELDEERPREITVRWVEPSEGEGGSEP